MVDEYGDEAMAEIMAFRDCDGHYLLRYGNGNVLLSSVE